MQDSRGSRALYVVILGMLVVLIGRVAGLSTGVIFLLLAMVLVVMWVYAYWRTWRTLGWFRTYNRYSARVREGEAAAVIDELAARRAQGDQTPETAFTLAAAYNYLGHGQKSEPLALEAFAAVAGSGACEASDLAPRARCDLVYLTRYDTLLAQGRFIEAAGGLRERIRGAIQPNFMTALVAWAYFLGEAYEQTREVLDTIQQPGTRMNNKRLLSPRFELVVAYMRHALKLADTHAIIAERRDNIEEWASTAARNAHNPYGERLAEIVDAMRALAAETAASGDRR